MLGNYLRIAWRSLVKNKVYSFINIIGLAAGLTCFTFISLWVADELGYDTFNTKYDRIVRLVSTIRTETGVEELAVTGAPMAKVLQHDYAEVENTVRLRMREEIVTHKGQQVLQSGILLTDPSFFDVFSYSLLKGNKATALSEPYSIILTESTAKKYFGDDDPMGQTLIFNMYDTGYGAPYKITGVMPDPPRNAHFTFNILASFKTIEVANPDVLTVECWSDANFYTYLLLKKGVDIKAFSQKIRQFYKGHIGALYTAWSSTYFYGLQPLRDIHLRSALQYEITANGSITQVYIFSTIGLFILLLAAINYTNLATARAAGRAKEVGIKKVAGAGKAQLILQYLSESVLTAFVALSFSFLFSFLLQPFFRALTGKDLSLASSPPLLFLLFVITLFLGLLSGVYPALVLSAFNPASVLKGAFKSSDKGILLRKTLVVSQFAITIVLITGIVVIYTQLSFINGKHLGFEKESLLFLRVHGNKEVISGYEAFKNELQPNPLIGGMATSNSMIGSGLSTGVAETIDGNGAPLQVNTAILRGSTGYLNVYGLKLVASRNFSSTTPATAALQQIIINETAVKKAGWQNPEAAIGKPFHIEDQQGIVIGVARDFHFNSLQQAITPLVIVPQEGHFSRITLKVDSKKATEVTALVKSAWKKHFPSAFFDYDFLSQQINAQYRSEEQFSQLFLFFSVLSLLIACLGLYGLISYTVFQKTKEIGIRKVLGSTAGGIAAMLLGNFIKLVLFACFIAMPVAGYIMNRWLQNFAYRVTLSWWMFTAAGGLVLLVALITIGFQAIKAAVANPVKSLRTE